MSEYLVDTFPFSSLDNDQLSTLLSHSACASSEINHIIDINRIRHLSFNPFTLNDTNEVLDGLNDSDAIHFPKQSEILDSCNYFLEDDFNLKFSKVKDTNPMSLIHFNVRSLSKNYEKLQNYLELLQLEFTAIALSETWIKDTHDISFTNIPGYKFIHKDRLSKSGGGVGLYLKENIPHKIRKDLICVSGDSLFLEITHNNKAMLIGVIYRPPDSDCAEFVKEVENILVTIDNEHKLCMLTGDFNLDLLNYSNHSPTSNFVDLMFSYSYFPIISKPTRVTAHSASLIDNIFTNDLNICTTSGILVSDISDHFAIFQINNSETKISNERSKPEYKRMFNDKNIANFSHSLRNVNWDNLDSFLSPNEAYNYFVNEISSLLDKHFPLQKVNKRYRKLRKPWMSLGLSTSCKKKSNLYYKYIKNPTEYRSTKYKVYRNKLNHLIHEAKKNYFSTQLELAKNDLKQTWNVIKLALNKNACTGPKYPSEFKSLDGRKITNKNDAANGFNDFFINVGPNLDKDIPPADRNDFLKYLSNDTNKHFAFVPTTSKEINQIISSLKNKSSAGYDEIPTFLIKKVGNSLSAPLSRIINLSLSKGVFPDKLKIAKVIPLYKADDPTLFSNYRPISILPTFSKIYEKVMSAQITKYLNVNKFLYNRQYGFRNKHSTAMALIDLVDKISQSIDNNEYTIGIFLDFSKAFDTVNHHILTSKLNFYGITDTSLSLLQNYLSNRQQYVQLNDISSNFSSITCGVPQGSILGPLLFLIYINDLPNASKIFNAILFADDTNLFYSNKDLEMLNDTINSELAKISDWLRVNRLSLNIKKTHFIVFTAINKKYDHNSLSVSINNLLISCKTSTKFLGIFLDQNLNWKTHINYIALKISKNIGVINKLKYLLPKNVLLSLYYTMIFPYLTYGNIVWASTYHSRLNCLMVLQKRIVRIITHSNYLAHTNPLFMNLHLLNIFEINFFQIACFVYLFYNNDLPDVFHNFFVANNSIHNYNTRNSSNLHRFKCRTTLLSFSTRQRAPIIWNSLNSFIKSSSNYHLFKRKLKQNILINHNLSYY